MANRVKSFLKTALKILAYLIALVLLFVCMMFGIVFLVESSVDWANTNCYMNQAQEVICNVTK